MALATLRRVLIGPPLPTQRLVHERLNRIQGLAVFASDALSSSAYATEEILLVLMAAGTTALPLAWPIALAITTVLLIVAFSYHQTIHAYPSGGGAYTVARDNLGVWPGLVAAAALLIDYILTVAVSVSAGVAAITSAVPALFGHRVALALLAVAVIALVNLRGVRESGTIFSVPTYLFIGSMLALIALGLLRTWEAPPVPPRLPAEAAVQPLSLMLLLRAFASGSAAMTGIEAISNGVRAFRPPEARNAGITLFWMAAVLSTLFLGLTWLATHLGVVPVEEETVVSQLARLILGTGPAYYVVQAATAMILILAANTSFADFPRLAAILARDRFLPTQLRNLGDRLVFANGIVALAVLAGGLIVFFDARTHALIPLYAVGVFLSFTLSQSGMVRRWWRRRGRGWVHSLLINLAGAAATAVVLGVVLVAKFAQGAWIVAGVLPLFVAAMRVVYGHYLQLRRELSLAGARPPAAEVHHKVVVPVGGINRAVLPALRYARSLSDDVTAVHVEVDPEETAQLRERWQTWGLGIPLRVLPSPYRSVLGPFLDYLAELEWRVGFDQYLTIVLPEFVPSRWWHFLLHNQTALLFKAALFLRRSRAGRITVVTDVPYYLSPPAEPEAAPVAAAEVAAAPSRGAVALLAGLLLAAAGLALALARGWAPLWQALFGLALLLQVALAAFLLFVRSLAR